MLRHKTFYVDTINQIEYCGNTIIHLKGSEFAFPFSVSPIETTHNLDSCEGCSKTHEQLKIRFAEKHKLFPKCCAGHSKLFELEKFALGNYDEVAVWSANKIMYSYHAFIELIDTDDWFHEITNYFDYCFESYGSFPLGFGEPFLCSYYFDALIELITKLEDSIESEKCTKEEIVKRTKRILSYLKSIQSESNFEDRETNFNLLLQKYNEWFTIFPFDLEYFKSLKEHYQKRIPLFKSAIKNEYLGTVKRELYSAEEFSEILISITKSILVKINGLTLYENGKLNEADKVELELIIEKRRLELKEMSLTSNTSTKVYIKTLKNWLKGEKKFIKEIEPYLKDSEPKEFSEESANDENLVDLGFKGLFQSEELYQKAIRILVEHNFIKNTEKGLKWIYAETKEFKTKQTIIALCVVLELKNYFKHSPRKVYLKIKNDFGISIHKGTYSKSSNGFKEDYERKKSKNFTYISLFKEIL